MSCGLPLFLVSSTLQLCTFLINLSSFRSFSCKIPLGGVEKILKHHTSSNILNQMIILYTSCDSAKTVSSAYNTHGSFYSGSSWFSNTSVSILFHHGSAIRQILLKCPNRKNIKQPQWHSMALMHSYIHLNHSLIPDSLTQALFSLQKHSIAFRSILCTPQSELPKVLSY